ncbi:MAG: transcriptional regulator [Synechococcus sp.]|uniref:TFIIB-type zinc ribbon-containing protein n=1 Tax=unclassified Synechococcus TaxID=2626047 RepID=UPI00180F1D8D|nr:MULTISPECIES: TFIIB-type zinc ribbon-containing protein [unclassified Synechococcus]MBA4736392.1 transcriptional regulator [Synechococcus sp.]MCB4388927.1 TFIIB-type zinc ribbon-containing protein [Synechococcus sp. MU1617]MDO6352843.1 TFIIB-type zinc ribbon-containing protein [Synechococcus sp. YX-04-1]
MAVTVCQNCGSRRFLADRSMAGRLVCQNCGLAAGSRAGRSAPGSSRRSTGTKKRWLVILLIAVIVLVVVTS